MKYYGVIEPPKKDGKVLKILIVGMLIIIAALSYMLYSTYNERQSEMEELKAEIKALKAENESITNQLSFTETKLDNAKSSYEKAMSWLESANQSVVEQNKLATQYKNEAEFWKSKYVGTDTDSTDLQTTFYSTEELVKAIRANPTKYANQKVTVLGTFYIDNSEKGVFDLPANKEVPTYVGVAERYYINKSSINTLFKSDSPSTVLRTGDYIKITGTVVIEFDELYLMSCDYEMVQLREDR